MKHLHELFTIFVSEEWIMQFDLGNKRQRAENKVFKTWLRRRSHGDCVAVTAKAGGDPQHVDFGYDTHAVKDASAATKHSRSTSLTRRDCTQRRIRLSRFSWFSPCITTIVRG